MRETANVKATDLYLFSLMMLLSVRNSFLKINLTALSGFHAKIDESP